MELTVESPRHQVEWKVEDFFHLPSEIGYSVDSPKFSIADDSYCLRLYPNGSHRDQDRAQIEIHLVRVSSTFPERNVSSKIGRRGRNGKGDEEDTYYSSSALNNILHLSRSFFEAFRDMFVPGDTLTVLCSIISREQSSGESPKSEGAETTDSKEKKEGLTGQSVFFSSRWRSSKMELSIESPCQRITWKVPNFFQLISKIGYSLISPEFGFADDRYCLRFYPKGDTADFELQLVKLTSTFPERIVLYKVGYREQNDFDIYPYSGTLIDEFGFCLSRSQLEERRNDFVPDGTLTLLCSMRLGEQSNAGSRQSEEVGSLKKSDAEVKQKGLPGDKASVRETSDEEETNSKSGGADAAKEEETDEEETDEEETDSDHESVKKLQKDLEKLVLNREDSDVTLEVQGIEFPVHRSILRARSPVFNAMFKHEMKETNSDVVSIEDSDPKTFPDFLKYLYTGSTKHVSQENVCQLYTTSDKYEVMELKTKCVEFMKSHISVETFCEYLSLAHMHIEEELIRSATEFFSAHTIEIVKTAKWQIFLQENSTVGNELFLKALLKGKNI